MAANSRIDHETTNLNVKLTKDSWGNPFQEGPPKITEGGPFDPHRQISRINPDKGVNGG